MNTIYKYQLNLGRTVVDLPDDAKVLTVQTQGDGLSMWAMIDPHKPTIRRFFDVYGTGHQMPADPGIYIATVQMNGGALVWHIFEGYTTASVEPDKPWPHGMTHNIGAF